MQDSLENESSAPSSVHANLALYANQAGVISSQLGQGGVPPTEWPNATKEGKGGVENGGGGGEGGGREQGVQGMPSSDDMAKKLQKTDEPFVYRPTTLEYGEAEESPAAHWHLFWASGAANLVALAAGCIFAWTSSAEKYFVKSDSNTEGISEEVWSWVAGLTPLGAALGPIPSGFLTDKFGRKPCLLGVGVLYIISWALIGFQNGENMLLIGRFIAGIATGALFTVLPMYIGEIAADSVRSTLGSLMQLSITLGFLLSYSVGPYVEPVILAAVSGAVPVIFLVAFFAMPESPYVLVARDDNEGASKTLAWLRGSSRSDVAKELAGIQHATDEANASKGPFFQQVGKLLCQRGNRRAFIISAGLLAFQQFSGINPVLFFAQSIFQKTGSSLDPAVCTIILGAVQMFASAGTLLLTGCFSMKTLLILSAGGMTVGHAVLGYYFYASATGNAASLGILPIIALVFYIVLYCFGFGPLPWAVMGEMFGGDVKATASSLCATFCWIVGFLLTWKFAALLSILGEYWTFWVFGIFCGVAGVFTVLLVPNTKGKSLQEIQDILNGRSR